MPIIHIKYLMLILFFSPLLPLFAHLGDKNVFIMYTSHLLSPHTFSHWPWDHLLHPVPQTTTGSIGLTQTCPSPYFSLLAVCSLSVFQGGTYIQFWKTFHPSICTSYWPICLPSFNSQQVPFALIFSPFMFFNLITQISAVSAENAKSLSWLSPGFIISSSAHFCPLAFAAWWACDSPASFRPYLCIISECSFCACSVGVSYGCVIGCSHLSYYSTVSCALTVYISS